MFWKSWELIWIDFVGFCIFKLFKLLFILLTLLLSKVERNWFAMLYMEKCYMCPAGQRYDSPPVGSSLVYYLQVNLLSRIQDPCRSRLQDQDRDPVSCTLRRVIRLVCADRWCTPVVLLVFCIVSSVVFIRVSELLCPAGRATGSQAHRQDR